MKVLVLDVMGVVLTTEGVNLPLISMVEKLRDGGLPCFLGSNIGKGSAERLWNHLGLKKHFDGIYASEQLGFWKPEIGFYKAIQDELELMYDDLTPADVLFFDDSQDNVKGARAFGWAAFHYTSVYEVVETLKKNNISTAIPLDDA